MAGGFYFLLTALPTLGEIGTAAPLTLGELSSFLGDAEGPRLLVETIALADDLIQRQALLAGEIEQASPSVLSIAQISDEEPLPDYLCPADNQDQTRKIPADALWAVYYRHAASVAKELNSPLLRLWIGLDVTLRNALATARAKALGLEPSDYLVATELSEGIDQFDPLINEWAAAPDPTSITVRAGEGAMGSDRVTILWADGAITNKWLEVTVIANANTGIEDDDIFYFGNAIGETGNSTSDAQVTPTDEVAVRDNPATLAINPAEVTDSCDFNRDKKVGPTDMILARNNGTNASTALPLIVLVPNTAPTVLAGSDETITLPTDTVSLDGTVTDDGYPDPPATVTTTWSKLSGPGAVAFGNASAVDTSATFTVPGDYVLQLEAGDTDLTATDQVAITVNPDPSFNFAPNVNGGGNKAIELPTNSVSIDATVTDDGNPSPPSTVTYAWTQISGTAGVVFGTPTAEDTTATFPAADTYVLRLTADDTELTAYDDVTVTVSNPPSVGSFQESGGMVVMEAENFSNNDTNSTSADWFEDTAFAGYAGACYMQAIGGPNQTWEEDSAELGYDIDFETPGTYSIWLRVNIDSTSSKTVAIGMDDTRIGNSLVYTASYQTWDWVKHTSDVVVSVGEHKFQLRRMNRHYRVDRIILTTNTSYVPAGTGPAESVKE